MSVGGPRGDVEQVRYRRERGDTGLSRTLTVGNAETSWRPSISRKEGRRHVQMVSVTIPCKYMHMMHMQAWQHWDPPKAS
jgi:hypothetical protein